MSGAFDARSLAVVVFLGFVAVSLLLCGLAAADQDDPEHFYAGGGSGLGPAGAGLAIAGDYISAATLLSTTGAVALAGFDGILFAAATVASLVLVMRILAEPLRRKGVFTLGDFLADRLGDPSVRRALGITTLVVLAPLLLVQLATAGRVMAAMFGLPDGALTGCTVASGALMVCYSAVGGMRGTGYIQILKVAVVLAAVTLLAGLVLVRYGWNPFALFDAARRGSGTGGAYARPGLQFGHTVAGALDLLGFQLTLLLGAACMPHIMMRLHPMRDRRTVRRATLWASVPVAFLCLGVVVVGFGASALLGREVLRAADPAGGTALLMVTGALDPGAGGPRESLLFACVACAVFATTLAAVAGITLAAASSLARDFTAKARTRTAVRSGRSAGREILRARLFVVLIGALCVWVSAFTHDRNPQVLLSLSFAACASVLPPVLLYALFRPGFSARGVRWTVYGTLPLTVALMVFSPAVSGTPVALLPDRDFHWFPLQTPGLITIPAGFLLGYLGSRTGRARRVREPGRENRTAFIAQ
ncbi:cation acetate symporter [Streptomyces laculatispora]|uniref:Cation acetate symporter n=1 Tax=Streptomyces laculatispora TaxID=887464 RepID=A0ABY9IA03_9ACTN|nr:cation acetate symporter [Streptomyces laculatispora]WLQ43615.1 cation acetate symporter [Streptomyces laculatispora]